MRQVIAYLLAVALLVTIGSAPAFAGEPAAAPKAADEQTAEPAMPSLTAAQKQELAQIYREIYMKKELLIQKYREFGIISDEMARHWSERLKARYTEVEKHGFLPPKRDCNKKGDRKKTD